MSVYKDFRQLATKDTRHGKLRWIPDIWYKKHVVLVEYDTDGKPLSGVVLKEEVCPIDPDADFRIYCWVGDMDKGQAKMEPGFKRSVEGIRQEMIKRGLNKVWGMVPKYSVHLTTFLDKISNASKCSKSDGDEITLITKDEYLEFNGYVFYTGWRDEVADFTKEIK